MGVSANGVLFPILVMVFDYVAKDSLSTIKMANLFVGIVNFVFILLMRNPNNGNRLYIDFNLIQFLIPLILMGSMIGCLSFMLLPPVFTYSIILVVIIIVTVRNFFKMMKMKEDLNKEKQIHLKDELVSDIETQAPSEITLKDSQQNFRIDDKYSTNSNSIHEEESSKKKSKLNSILSNSQENSDKSLNDDDDVNNDIKPEKETQLKEIPYPSLWSLLWEVKLVIFFVIICFSLMIIANLGKGSNDKPSVFNFENCSIFAIVFYSICMIPMMLIAYLAFNKLRTTSSKTSSGNERKLSFPLAIKIGLSSFLGGFISTMGVSGSLFISAFLLLLGIEPIIVKCTMSFMILVMALNNSFQFFYMGYFDWRNILTLAVISILGCLLANFIIKKKLAENNSKTVNFIISSCSFAMTLILCFVLPVSSYVEYLSNADFFSFSSSC
jgi:uncharacterized membrane protein YfcA